MVGVIGDSTFIHSGITGLINAVYNQSGLTLVILDNSTTGMTGHQEHPCHRQEYLRAARAQAGPGAAGARRGRQAGGHGRPYDLKAMDTALKEETESGEVSVIIARRPCALLDKSARKQPLTINAQACKNCKSCLNLRCPAIENREGGLYINPRAVQRLRAVHQGLSLPRHRGGASMKTISILIVGVGGQGTLLTSRVLGKLAVDAGYQAKVSEVHGMAQRGGSVVTYVRFGEQVASPLIEPGQADVILAFEKLEACAGRVMSSPTGMCWSTTRRFPDAGDHGQRRLSRGHRGEDCAKGGRLTKVDARVWPLSVATSGLSTW